MRTAAVVLAAIFAGLPMQTRAPASRPACTTATSACTEWVALGSGTSLAGRSLIYRTYSLDARNDAIRRALIMVHGTNRNADHYFSTATAAAFLAGAIDDTVVISPRIASNSLRGPLPPGRGAGGCSDTLDTNEVNWSCNGDSWRSGGNSTSHPDLTSFDFVDQILRKLANKSVFPNMKAIVVAGHSAGGQFVARYQMANTVHDTLGVPITYVVANPSSYAWPDATRPMASGDGAPDSAKAAWNSEDVHTKFSYGAFDASACANYDKWPFGLEGRTGGYTAKTSDDRLKSQLASRPTTYLFGQVDVLPLGGFDSSCSAMAQGATRRARGEAFVKYVNERLGAKHAVQIVSECGHNDRCVYTTDKVFLAIFPKPSS